MYLVSNQRYRQIVRRVNHRLALNKPALPSAPSKKTELGAAHPLRGKKRVSARLRPEGSGRYDFGGM